MTSDTHNAVIAIQAELPDETLTLQIDSKKFDISSPWQKHHAVATALADAIVKTYVPENAVQDEVVSEKMVAARQMIVDALYDDRAFDLAVKSAMQVARADASVQEHIASFHDAAHEAMHAKVRLEENVPILGFKVTELEEMAAKEQHMLKVALLDRGIGATAVDNIMDRFADYHQAQKAEQAASVRVDEALKHALENTPIDLHKLNEKTMQVIQSAKVSLVEVGEKPVPSSETVEQGLAVTAPNVIKIK